ncbi:MULTISPECIES: TMEM175 family protein [unclassified Streptomyces]|uniref:TMEM175 family protein n=1 Tax=unclassified Streptomyces TaxID=2593676 RepID=UPI003D90463D
MAIAITLLVLEIHAPCDTSHLLHSLAALWPSYLAYAITFMLIGQVWASHHILFDHIRSVDRVVLYLNTVLLMDIALLPFATSVLAEAFRDGHGQRTAVVLHGTSFWFMDLLFNVIWWHARHDRHHDRLSRRRSHQSPLPARPRLDRHRSLARPPASPARRGRDRRLHSVLLASQRERDRQDAASARRSESGVTTIMDDLAVFTGDFVLTVDHAWTSCATSFSIETEAPRDLGERCEL